MAARRPTGMRLLLAVGPLLLLAGCGTATGSAAEAPRRVADDTVRAELFYLVDRPESPEGYWQEARRITPRTVEIESTGDPGYDALHALLTLDPPESGLTEGFNVLDRPGRPPTIDVASVTHEDGVVRVELTGTPYDPYPTVDFCCPSDGRVVTQQVVHTVQAALDTDDPVEIAGRGVWLVELDGPVAADPDIVLARRH